MWEGLNPPYRTIVVDPPWEYPGAAPWRSTSRQTYSLMPISDIAALPVRDLATPDAHLYLWSVLPLMAQAYEVVAGWGFTAETLLTWCKPGPGLGGGFRGNTEHVIVARRTRGGAVGLPSWVATGSGANPSCARCGGRARGARKCGCAAPEWRVKGVPVAGGDILTQPFLSTADGTWYHAPRGEHSAKPERFLDLAEQMSPGPRVELFARQPRLGWDSWGYGYESRVGEQEAPTEPPEWSLAEWGERVSQVLQQTLRRCPRCGSDEPADRWTTRAEANGQMLDQVYERCPDRWHELPAAPQVAPEPQTLGWNGPVVAFPMTPGPGEMPMQAPEPERCPTCGRALVNEGGYVYCPAEGMVSHIRAASGHRPAPLVEGEQG